MLALVSIQPAVCSVVFHRVKNIAVLAACRGHRWSIRIEDVTCTGQQGRQHLLIKRHGRDVGREVQGETALPQVRGRDRRVIRDRLEIDEDESGDRLETALPTDEQSSRTRSPSGPVSSMLNFFTSTLNRVYSGGAR